MKLTFLQVDQTNPRLGERFERYPPFFQTWLGAHGFDFETVYLLDGAAPPDPSTLQGAIITGSKFGVYDRPPWIDPLRDFIRSAYQTATPMLGICFGHQIMADALGAEVGKSSKGWGIGRQDYRLAARPGWAEGLPQDISLAASHQDQVHTRPAEAQIWLESDFCPIAGLAYANGAAISLQPHPEYPRDYAKALVDLREGEALTPEQAAERRASLDAGLDGEAVAAAIARFFLER